MAEAALKLAPVPTEPALRRAIASLRAGGDQSAGPRYTALGALYHALAQVTGETVVLVDALEYTERALEEQPQSGAARFNRALIESDLGLCRQPREAWNEYLAQDDESPWTEEARARRDALPCDSPGTEGETPEDIFEEAVERLLPAWARARRESREEADALLDRIARQGDRLARAASDPWLLTLATELSAAGEHRASAVLAYTQGRARFKEEDYEGAKPLLLRARSLLHEDESVLAPWCDLRLAGIRINDGDLRGAEDTLSAYRSDSKVGRFPMLSGRIDWALGLAALRDGRLEAARDLFADAREKLARGGYRFSAAWVQTNEAETLTDLGFVDESWDLRVSALRALQNSDSPFPFHNGLVEGARAAALRGAYRTGHALLREAFDFAQETGNSRTATEALLAQGEVFVRQGALEQALQTYGAALEAIPDLEEPRMRERLDARARLGLWQAQDPDARKPLSDLDEVIVYYSDTGPAWREIQALRVRARAERHRGMSPSARSTIQQVIARVRAIQREIGDEPLGFRHWESVQDLFDEAIEHALTSRRPMDALVLLEQARRPEGAETESLPFRSCQAGGGPPPPAGAREARRPVMLVFGVIGERLVWWLLQEDSCRFGLRRQGELRSAIEDLLDQAVSGDVRPELLETLYRDLLGEPLKGVAEGAPLVLVPDKYLLRVPFAALRNPQTGRHLAQERPLSFRLGIYEWTIGDRRSTLVDPAGWRILVVGDPAFDRSSLPWLPRLPGAASEARRIASLYPSRALLLSGAEATADRLRTELSGRQVLHLAAHAVPGPGGTRDVLVLASDPKSGSSGLVSTLDLVRPDASSLDLVVLSACSTLGTTPSRAGGLVGLAQPFVARGAAAVVGTLWPIEDRMLSTIMIRFHQGLLDGLPASESLRRAQLAVLESEGICCGWAAVQLVGEIQAGVEYSPHISGTS